MIKAVAEGARSCLGKGSVVDFRCSRFQRGAYGAANWDLSS
jgi:hypothetical protein